MDIKMFGLMIRVCIFKEILGEKFGYFNLFLMGVGSGLGIEIENNKLKIIERKDVDIY